MKLIFYEFLKGVNCTLTREERKRFNYEQSHQIINGIAHKFCYTCKTWYPMTEEYFYKWSRSVDGFMTRCKCC